jgi:hypothetical protein
MSETKGWQVWLGCRASIWSHRGYEVRGETVYVESESEAEHVVRRSLPDGAVRVSACDADYWYADAEMAERDDDGIFADAVVSRADE